MDTWTCFDNFPTDFLLSFSSHQSLIVECNNLVSHEALIGEGLTDREVLIELGNLWRIVHPNKKLAWMQQVYEVIITLKTILWSEVAKFASLPSQDH